MNSDQWQLPSVVLPATESPLSQSAGQPGALAALDPRELAAAAQRAERELLQQGHSDNTARSYRAALRYWAAWALARYHTALTLPVPALVVVQFIVDHARRYSAAGALVHELPDAVDEALVRGGFKGKRGAPSLATLQHRLAVLAQLHHARQLPSPTQEPRVRELLTRTRRAYAARGERARQAPALSRDPLEAMLLTCDDTLRGRRDRALLLFAFSSGGRRRCEVTAATCENTRRAADGSYTFALRRSKTNPEGREQADHLKPVQGRAALALTAWLESARIVQGPLFRRVRRGGVLGEPLASGAVREIVRARAALAGLTEAFTAHSLRAGFVTEAGRQGVPLGDTMAMTGHRSVKSLLSYFRALTTASRAARLLDDSYDP